MPQISHAKFVKYDRMALRRYLGGVLQRRVSVFGHPRRHLHGEKGGAEHEGGEGQDAQCEEPRVHKPDDDGGADRGRVLQDQCQSGSRRLSNQKTGPAYGASQLYVYRPQIDFLFFLKMFLVDTNAYVLFWDHWHPIHK